MPRCRVVNETSIDRTPRLMQVEGMFDLSPDASRRHSFEAELPEDTENWRIGLIVGASGSGKTSLLRELYGRNQPDYEWPRTQSVLDGFPDSLSVKEIAAALSRVGFSSPPAWRTPFCCLSTGEQFRVTLARALCDNDSPLIMDEFTSVVDRTVAQIGSAAFAKAVRAGSKRAVLASCHRDIIEWLEPDWVYDTDVQSLSWRSLQRRPAIELEVRACGPEVWEMFRHHHYLDHGLRAGAWCFLAAWRGAPVAFASAINAPHQKHGLVYREHRTVCLPDYQGVGIGSRLSGWLGSLVRGLSLPYYSRTSHPAMIAHRMRSGRWAMFAKPGFTYGAGGPRSTVRRWKGTATRLAASFRYIGPAMSPELATSLAGEAKALARPIRG